MEGSSIFSGYEAPSQQERDKAVAAALQQFNEEFPSDEHCVEEIIKRLNVDFCKLCGSVFIERKFGQRKLRCYTCKHTSWPLAGTFFARMKRPRLYLGVILLMEQGITVSAKSLENLFGTAYATVFELLQRIRITIISFLTNGVQMQTKAFAKMLFRRSVETLAGKHPSIGEEEEEEEEEEDDDDDEDEDDDEQQQQQQQQQQAAAHQAITTEAAEGVEANLEKNREIASPAAASSSDASERGEETLEKQIKCLLSSEPISFEEIVSQTRRTAGEVSAALTMLELFQHAIRIPGDRYASPKRTSHGECILQGEASGLVTSLYAFVRHYFGGISRRYLQSYIGSYWINVDRRRWAAGALFKAIKDYGRFYLETLDGLSGKAQISFPQ